ncbi:hypothetical protein ACHWQZ_G004414 [Mnemiopsis leidyi]
MSEDRENPTLGYITSVLAAFSVFGNLNSILAISRVIWKSPRGRVSVPTEAQPRRPSTEGPYRRHVTLLLALSVVNFAVAVLHITFVAIACFQGYWLDMTSSSNEEVFLKQILNKGTWCNVSSYFVRAFSSLAISTVSVIGIERTVTIWYPLRATTFLSNRRVLLLLLFLWAAALGLQVQEGYMRHIVVYVVPAYQCVKSYTNPGDVQTIIGTYIAFNMFNMLIIMVTSSATVVTLVRMRKVAKSVSTKCVSQKRRKSDPSNKIFFLGVTSLIIVCINTFTWLPYNLLSILRYVLRYNPAASLRLRNFNLRTVVWWIQYVSPALSPLIFVFRIEAIRVEAVELFRTAFKPVFNFQKKFHDHTCHKIDTKKGST